MQYYNNILTVEASWLIQQGVFTPTNYKQLSARKDVRVVRRGCRGTEALVDYESLPERFKRKVNELVPNPYKAVRVNVLETYIQHSAEATDYFDSYMMANDKYLPADTRKKYYANAIVLDAVGLMINERAAKRRALGGNATRFWDKIKDAVQELDAVRYPHTLPNNARSLERRFKKYKSEGYESLVHENYKAEIKNSAHVETPEQINAMGVLLSDPRNLDNAQVARLYNMMAKALEWKTIGASTVGVWRDKMEYETFGSRRGNRLWDANKAMQVKRRAPQYPLYFWSQDGWDVELMYKSVVDGKTVYFKRPTVIVVLDACTKYPIGYAIGTHETPGLNNEALRNAVKHTESLFGQMYRTAELQSDHYAKKKMTPLYMGVSDKYVPAKVGNAKAKPVERYWKDLNKNYCQFQKNWSGFGITSRKELQPNSDYLNKHHENYPDFAGVCRQVINIIEAERAAKKEEYLRLFHEMPSENRFTLPYDQYLMMFGEITGNKNLLQGSGLNITINGIKRTYDCFAPAFRRHASTRWEVRYDPEDLSHAIAVNEDETLRFMLEEKYIQPMALIERKKGDYEQLQRVLEFNRQETERIEGQRLEYVETTAGLLGHNKDLETLQKLMICDSTGQHKDQRNKARLRAMPLLAQKDEQIDTNEVYDDY